MVSSSDTRDVRDGEDLDLNALASYLEATKSDLSGPLSLRQFPGGHSNLTYLLTIGDREYVLRRPPKGREIKTAHDMGREFKILNQLQGHYQRIAKPILFCDDSTIIGGPFYLMERLNGIVLRSQTPPDGIDLDEATMLGLSQAVIDNLADIHSVDLNASGLADFGKPAGFIERQVSGWTRRYQAAKTDEIPGIEAAANWLTEHLPKTVPKLRSFTAITNTTIYFLATTT